MRVLHGNVIIFHCKISLVLHGQVTYAVCSGSEANDLAFRIARAVRICHAGHPAHM